MPTITESKITSYITRKGLNVLKVAVFRNKRRGTTVIRLNMVNNSESRRVLDPGFWPKGVTCRYWLSYNAYRRKNQNALSKFPILVLIQTIDKPRIYIRVLVPERATILSNGVILRTARGAQTGLIIIRFQH